MADDRHEADERLIRLERQMEAVLANLERLNSRLGSTASFTPPTPAATRPQPPVQAIPSPTPEAPREPAVPRVEFQAPQASTPPETSEPPGQTTGRSDWENVIGRQWALWIGATAIFLAVAFFLAYAWGILSIPQRLAIGAFAGLALLFGGEFARASTRTGFSEGLIGGGLAILYLDAWIACAGYGLSTYEMSLELMVIVTALGVIEALRFDSRSLLGLATIGGFAAPVLLSRGTGGGGVVPFLAYYAVLNIGLLAVSTVKAWRGNVLLAAAGTYVVFGGWISGGMWRANAWLAFVIVTAIYLMYAVSAAYPVLVRRKPTISVDWLLLLTATAVYFGIGFVLTTYTGVVPCIFPLALAAAFGISAYALSAISPRDVPLQTTATGITCAMLAIAVPIQMRYGWISVGWSVLAAVMLTVATVSGSVLIRRAGQIVWLLAALAILSIGGYPTGQTLMQMMGRQGIPILAFTLCTAWAAEFRRASIVDEVRSVYAMAWVAAGAWFVTSMVHDAFLFRSNTVLGSWTGSEPYVMAMTVSVFAVLAHSLAVQFEDVEARITAAIAAGVGLAITVTASLIGEPAAWRPILNPRFAAYIVGIGGLIVINRISQHQKLSDAETRTALWVVPGIHLLVICCAAFEIIGAYALTPFEGWETVAALTIGTLCTVYGAILFLPAFSPDRWEIRLLAFCLAIIGLVAFLSSTIILWSTASMPVVNGRFVAFTIITVSLVSIALLCKPYVSREESQLPLVAMTAAAGIALWGLTQETYNTCNYYQAAIGDHWMRWAQSSISVVWTLAASGFLSYGITRDHRLTRLVALCLFGVTIGKVFLFDLSFLENQFRVLSFGGLGIALIGISWLYNRFGGGGIGTGHWRGGIAGTGGGLSAHSH